MQLRNDPKCAQIQQSGLNHQFRLQWGGFGAFVAKNPDVTSWNKLFALIAPVHPILHRVSCSYETIPNAPKHYETHQNMSLWSNDYIRCVGCENLPRDFVARILH